MATSFTAPRMDLEDANKEFEQLGENERQEAFRDLYGKVNQKPENPDEIREQLAELDETLQRIPNHQKEHLLRAQELCPDIANNESFRLRFLRADFYNVRDAATRMLKYWRAREETFGEDRAYRELVLADFDENDLSNARSNGMWVLPEKDKAGRFIYFTVKPNWSYPDRRHFMRWFWYITEAALEDEGVQTAGAVAIGFDDGPFSLEQFDRKLESRLYYVALQCLPVRGMAIHHCFDSKVHEFVIPFMLFLMGKKIRARYRIYPGSKSHLRISQFEEMGIPKEILPRMMGGMSDFDVNGWIDARRRAGK